MCDGSAGLHTLDAEKAGAGVIVRNISMSDINETANGVSSFSLSWIILLTLIRKNIVKKEEILQTLELIRSPKGPSPVLDELKNHIESLGKL